MKKIIKYVLVVIVILFLQVRCSDSFLEQTKYDSLNEDLLFKTEADGIAAVTGVYDMLHYDQGGITMGSVDGFLKSVWYVANYFARDVVGWGSDGTVNKYNISPLDASPTNFWILSYIGIARANEVIEILEQMKTNGVLGEELGNRLIAECKFLRAYAHNYLALVFGEVPVILEPSVDGKEPQQTQDEVFKAVVDDMMEAAEYLPWSYDAENKGRATKGAALTYAGEAYMWLKDYKNAEETLQQIYDYSQLNPSVVGLESNFWDIHQPDHQNGKETLFAIQYQANPAVRNWNRGDDLHWFQYFTMPDVLAGSGYCYASPELYRAFEKNDTRRIATVIGSGEEHPGCPINEYKSIQDSIAAGNYPIGFNTLGTMGKPWIYNGRSGYYVMKFWRLPASIIDPIKTQAMFSDVDLIMMRYGEVILDLAEAKWRNGNEAGARTLIKEIRDRAWNGSGVTPPEPTGTIEDILVHEYRCELAGEFSFFFILRRMGVDIDWVKKNYGVDIPMGRDIYPIPQGQIDLNPNLHQTDGYK